MLCHEGARVATVLDKPSIPTIAQPIPRYRTPPDWSGFWPRVAVVGVLSVVAYAFVVAHVLAEVLSGSRAVTVIVLPLLTVMIAAGYRRAPKGVSDAESDWITAILVTTAGLTFVALVGDRYPTIAGQWSLELVAIVMWVAALSTVMLGIRYVTRMWDMWVFALACASPLPLLLTGAQLGGSDLVLASQACALAALAVLLASRTRPLPWRFAAAGASLVLGVGVAALVLSVFPGRLALAVAVMIAAGILPVLVVATFFRIVPPQGLHDARPPAQASFPDRSPLSIVVLVMATLVILGLHPPADQPQIPTTTADWIARSGLVKVSEFSFITGLLGPGSTLTRYAPPADAESPTVAVDVITTPNAGALADYDDAIWYPTDKPINYRPVALAGAPISVRMAHTEGDAAVTENAVDWYALTWVWRTPTESQQVTVVVAQQDSGRLPDPVPQSLAHTMTNPVIWVVRQQPDPVERIDARVTKAGHRVARDLVTAAGLKVE